MRKICFLHRSHFSRSTGGAELQAHYLAQSLVKRGWDVHYILEGKNTPNKVDGVDGITFHWIEERPVGAGLLNYRQLSKVLREIAPDVIYQRGALDYTGIVAALARRQKIRYVWAAASNRDCQKRKYTSPRWHGARIQRLINPRFLASDYLISYGIRRADVAIAQSRDQQNLLVKHFAKPSHVVKSGHPLPEHVGSKSMPPIVLWTANMKGWKRVDTFVALARACQDVPATFLVIGDDRRQRFRHVITPAIGNFRYLGPRHVTEVERFMCTASVFVNTSTAEYEGFPNTFIQAWMRETPVVSLNTDPDDLIKTHQLGFHSGNFDQMLRDVKVLLADDHLRRQMGDRAHQYATKEHNIAKTADSLTTIITSLA